MHKKQKNSIQRKREEQEMIDNTAVALSQLFGAKVIQKNHYDFLNQRNKELLEKNKDLGKVGANLIFTQCKLQAFIKYHSKWKPKTRIIERRIKKLTNEKLYVDFSVYPSNIAENLKEAYNCYINDLKMACYIMILRTIEIAVSHIYDQQNPPKTNSKGKPEYTPAIAKLNWVKTQKIIGGADYIMAKAFIEARNDCVHENYIPTEKQIISAFETVINLMDKIKVSPSSQIN